MTVSQSMDRRGSVALAITAQVVLPMRLLNFGASGRGQVKDGLSAAAAARASRNFLMAAAAPGGARGLTRGRGAPIA